MPISKMKCAIAMIAIGLCSTACTGGSGGGGGGPNKPSDSRLSGLWPSANVDASNLNVSKDTVLTPENISSIVNIDPENTQKMLNIDPLGAGITSVDSTPVIDNDGNVYIATGGGSLIAYNSNGAQLWKRDLKDDTGNAEFFDESPLLTKDFVFIAGRRLHKLNIKNGTDAAEPLVFNPTVARSIPAYTLGTPCPFVAVQPSQLMLADDKVIYALSFSNEAFCGRSLYPYSQGRLIAFNAFDKKGLSIAWDIDLTTIGPNGKPMLDHEGNPISLGAGLASFGGGGVDPKRRLFFIGTGELYSDPSNPNVGTPSNPGKNLSAISNSLIAVNYDTGKIVWNYQYLANDTWGGGEPQYQVYDGKHDLNVHAHPQIFSMDGRDFVGARSKDGTYRIFLRDQVLGQVQPIAQILLDPATAVGGTLQVDPVIVDDTLYIASTAWIENATTDVFDPGLFPDAKPYTLVDGRRSSVDMLMMATGSQFAGALYATTTFRAIDLKKLIAYGAHQQLKRIKTPICVGGPNSSFNPNTTLNGDPSCTDQLPNDIIKWTTVIKPLNPLASSGMTYSNGVLILGGVQGVLTLIDTKRNGEVISSPAVNPIVPVPLASNPALPSFLVGYLNALGIQGVPILGGVSTANGKLFIPVGLAYPSGSTSPISAYGGLVIYKKP